VVQQMHDLARPSRRYDERREVQVIHQAIATGSIKLGSLFLTLPTRLLTGQHVIASDGYGARRALSGEGRLVPPRAQVGQT
jgi:hypothetical protein